MDRQVLTALQLNVIKLERNLGVLARPTRFGGEHMAYKLRPLGNLGSVSSLG
jgi:hypothetical protein